MTKKRKESVVWCGTPSAAQRTPEEVKKDTVRTYLLNALLHAEQYGLDIDTLYAEEKARFERRLREREKAG